MILWNYTLDHAPKFEFGRVEFASSSPGGPPVSKVNVEPWHFVWIASVGPALNGY